MTAEIVLMNKSAVAMAADSAVTVSNGSSDKKVFNTAAKVFTLSKHAPVGIMIYSGADFCGVPWETIIKDYRQQLGSRRFSTLECYSQDFFSYVEENDNFFSAEVKNTNFRRSIYSLLTRLNQYMQNNKIAKSILDSELDRLSALNFLDEHDQSSVSKFINENKQTIDNVGKYFFAQHKTSYTGCPTRVRRYVALSYLKQEEMPAYSGLVISGFGENDVFPSLVSMTVSDFLFDKIHKNQCRSSKITNTTLSDIVPYAQTQMMNTVLSGALPSYQLEVLQKFYLLLTSLPNEIIDGISELSPELKLKYKRARAKAGSSVLQTTLDEFKRFENDRLAPMKSAISVMPKSELAIVAEVFVNVAQLEHRLSLAAETVGGPVDVAIISKGDGFVWIKRKHYFDATLNPGFVENYYDRDYISSNI